MEVFFIFLLALGLSSAVPNGRIAGGVPTTAEHYPSLVQVESLAPYNGQWELYGAANVLNQLYVLSSAQIFEYRFLVIENYRIRAGATYESEGGQIYYIEEVYNHPGYSGTLNPISRYDNDISVVKLSSPLVYSSVIQPIAIIAQDYEVPDNTDVILAGWGANESFWLTHQLHELESTTLNIEECRSQVSELEYYNGEVTDNMFCVKAGEGKGVCIGDVGGPVYIQNILVGIISFALGCGFPDAPAINTKISAYTDWIVETAV